jgi:cell division protease FtsH
LHGKYKEMSTPETKLRELESYDSDEEIEEAIERELQQATVRALSPTVSQVSAATVTSKRLRLFERGSRFAPVQKEDIVGIDNVLTQVDEVIHWLTHHEEYAKLKARPEPGVLFIGQPGTGKTYTSRYMATVSDAKFIDVRDFPYAGKSLAAQDIKDLFTISRRVHAESGKPIILFWDEFEGAARERSRTPSLEQASVVSQLTAELDGIGGKPAGILLIGCTNYADSIDMALKRSGRMGLHVVFNAPDRSGKKKLLEHYITKIKVRGEVDYDTASYFFNDWDTAAVIEEAVQQAWRFAVRRSIDNQTKPFLTENDLLEVFLKRLVGPPPAFSEITPETMYRVSVHETGHALAATLIGVPLRLVTIRPGRDHLGKTMTFQADPKSSTVQELLNQLKVGVAGTIAQEVTGTERSAGSAGDTKMLTEIAVDLIDAEGIGGRNGMFNPAATRKRFYNGNPSVSQKIIEDSDLDVKALIDQASKEVQVLFKTFGAKGIEALAKRLVEVQTMTGKQFLTEVRKLG